MSLAIVHTRAQLGVQAPPVTVEAHLSNGLPGFTIVGLPETAVRESKDRVRSALLNSHFEFPQRRITVNLAPADLPKEGARYDLAIALGILAASDQLPKASLEQYEFIGELALSGELRRVGGSIPSALACHDAGRALILPAPCADEVALCSDTPVFCAENLLQVCAHLHDREHLPIPQKMPSKNTHYESDFADVKGQAQAKRAMEIAASGGHNMLLFGPPGTGKSMLASRLPSIMPPLEQAALLEIASVRSVSSAMKNTPLHRPYRSPHHTSSAVAIVGGGSNPKPGEISLAHHGVLFLDEFPEFNRSVLEVLREPLESGHICISRANAQVEFPAQFQLVAAMNPCPCGYFGDGTERCSCTPTRILRYKDKISGPLLDRIDLQVHVRKLPLEQLHSEQIQETSDEIRSRVAQTNERQHSRQGINNARLQGKILKQHCNIGSNEKHLLSHAIEKLNLSARAYDRTLRVARTIADMDGVHAIAANHISEALGYRNFDRFYARVSQY